MRKDVCFLNYTFNFSIAKRKRLNVSNNFSPANQNALVNMKKYFEIISPIIFVLITLHFLSCSASIETNNLENKRGNIKKIEAYKFNFKNDSMPKSEIHFQTKYFNSAGLLIKEINYDSIGAHSWITVNPKTEPLPESDDKIIRRIKKIKSEMLPSLKELFDNKKLENKDL